MAVTSGEESFLEGSMDASREVEKHQRVDAH
jgi:hypothetical protein